METFKRALLEFVNEFNNTKSKYKITYYEIYNDMYCLYVEDILEEIEYQSENCIDSFIGCESVEDYKRIMLEIVSRDLERESE